MSDSLLTLEVEGRVLDRWTSVAVNRHLEAVAGGFRVELLPGVGEHYPILPGQRVTVRIGQAAAQAPVARPEGEIVLDGFCDTVEASFDGTRGRSMIVAGRDKTSDLVDCSARHAPGEWRNILLPDLADILAAPFGVVVEREGPDSLYGPPFELFKLQQGETAWSALDRAARFRGVLPHSNGQGRLLLTQPGAGGRAAALVEGGPRGFRPPRDDGNVEKATLRYTWRNRFQVYTIQGQRAGSDQQSGSIVAAVQAESSDSEIDRFRPLLVLAEGQLSDHSAKVRAEWEASVRAARSIDLSVEVRGWRQGPGGARGRLWDINTLAEVRIPSLQLVRQMLIRSVRFVRDSRGTRSALGLTRGDGYVPMPDVEPAENPFRGLGNEEEEE